MSQRWWKDDDQLLAALGAALRSERTVPAGFISMGKAAFSRRGIDAELAALTYDPATCSRSCSQSDATHRRAEGLRSEELPHRGHVIGEIPACGTETPRGTL